MHKVIVIEDDVLLNNAFCRYLKAHGFETESAYSNTAALNFLSYAEAPTAVILDLHLEDGDSTPIIQHLNHSRFDETYLVVVSGAAFSPKHRLDTQRVDQFLMKPVSPRGLVTMLKTALGL